MGCGMGHSKPTKGHELTTTQTPIEAATDIVQKFYRAGQDDGFAPADMATASADGYRARDAEIAKLKGQRMVLCALLGECLPVIDALMQVPGDDDSDARLNGLAGRIMDALNVIAEDRVKGGES